MLCVVLLGLALGFLMDATIYSENIWLLKIVNLEVLLGLQKKTFICILNCSGYVVFVNC